MKTITKTRSLQIMAFSTMPLKLSICKKTWHSNRLRAAFTTSQMYWDASAEWLFTEKQFRFVDQDFNINAIRLDTNKEFSNFKTESYGLHCSIRKGFYSQKMKNFVISEILYWVIAIISLYKTVTLWGIEPQQAYLFLGFFVFYLFLWLYFAGITEKIH